MTSKTRVQLKELTTDLLDGFNLGDGIFNSLLDIAQSIIENKRPWMILRAQDTTQQVSSSDNFETQKSLPADFRKWYSRAPIVLLDSNQEPVAHLREIPINLKNRYKHDNGKFYVNYRTKKLFICGKQTQTFTIQQNYILRTTAVSADNNNIWDFPQDFHSILAMWVAVIHREGIDYDPISANNASGITRQIQEIWAAMTDWDNDLQQGTVEGRDFPYDGEGRHLGELSGQISKLI
jgi:hypothetical protein